MLKFLSIWNLSKSLKLFLSQNPFFTNVMFFFFSSLICCHMSPLSEIQLKVKLILYTSLFLSFTFLLYQIIYYWRNLTYSTLSFIRFTLFILQLLLFLFGIFNLFSYTIPPIHINDLSIFSQYRYLVFSIFSILTIITFIIYIRAQSSLSNIFYIISIRHEIYAILYTWNQTIFGDYCSKLIEWLAFSMLNRILYVMIHFIIFFSIRIITL